jgi:hypothetical protein
MSTLWYDSVYYASVAFMMWPNMLVKWSIFSELIA